MANYEKDEAMCLRVIDFSETSQVVTLLGSHLIDVLSRLERVKRLGKLNQRTGDWQKMDRRLWVAQRRLERISPAYRT